MDIEEGEQTKEVDRNNIKSTIENYRVQSFEAVQRFARKRENYDLKDQLHNLKREKNIFKRWDDINEGLNGRMSPIAKEKIYRLYIKGTSIKDLSLKFGALPQRIKAIIYQKHLYWEEVYPRTGETQLRAALETEAMYAAKFPFVDYGCDLHVMAELEKGMRIEKFHETDADVNMEPTAKIDVETYLSKMKSRVTSQIPEKFVGKGPHGYMLYDWVHHRKSGAAKPSEQFKRVVMRQGTDLEHHVKPMLIRRSKVGGVRWAVQKLRKRK